MLSDRDCLLRKVIFILTTTLKYFPIQNFGATMHVFYPTTSTFIYISFAEPGPRTLFVTLKCYREDLSFYLNFLFLSIGVSINVGNYLSQFIYYSKFYPFPCWEYYLSLLSLCSAV